MAPFLSNAKKPNKPKEIKVFVTEGGQHWTVVFSGGPTLGETKKDQESKRAGRQDER